MADAHASTASEEKLSGIALSTKRAEEAGTGLREGTKTSASTIFQFFVYTTITFAVVWAGYGISGWWYSDSSPSIATETTDEGNEPTDLKHNEVVRVGKKEVEVEVGYGNCILPGKNFDKVKVMRKDGGSDSLHHFWIVSKTSTPTTVTFWRYPWEHKKCDRYRKRSS